jgi:protein AroM
MKRLGFATIGQAPRSDIVPEIVAALGVPLEVLEAGALDGLDDAAIAKLAPQPGEYSFATRLADGRQVVLGKAAAEARLAAVLARMDRAGLDMIVVLCAGTRLPRLERTLLIEPQRIVDGLTVALAANVKTLGIVMPLERQVAQFRLEGAVSAQLRVTHASPYEGDRFADAGRELAGCDLVVMHCMGHGAAMRAKVAAASGVPTLTAPALVAGVLKQLLS